MPFTKARYGTRAKFNKMKRCVKEVKTQGSKYNPYAVCRASIYKKRQLPFTKERLKEIMDKYSEE